MEQMMVPPWLEPLLATSFFTICPRHSDSARSECNMFCLDCKNGSFCFYCRSSKHKDHLVLQIRRSSYHDVVRVGEIQNVTDISGVQTYVINSARVIFLNERPQPKSTSTSKGVSPHLCEICGRSLLDPFRFCSLGCKVEGIKKIRVSNFNLSTKNEEIEGRRLASKEEAEEEELRVERPQEMYRTTSNQHPPSHHNSNSRRRKGIPHRAPFGS
ncbi:protein RGF1 INDUCIBLE TRANSCRIPTION FACTOR 1 [Mercurialis annua]|uniref:protein RGF1 INDUCIBLE TRANSCRIPTION FACTOR 1 n=1 Tax=Mercurialis annua TaxID=3986 RepID=UPI00215FF925|nr:protein RGF1 INDUCIBLE TRANSCRIPTION FACTOR 1 [Mercurialis annua]